MFLPRIDEPYDIQLRRESLTILDTHVLSSLPAPVLLDDFLHLDLHDLACGVEWEAVFESDFVERCRASQGKVWTEEFDDAVFDAVHSLPIEAFEDGIWFLTQRRRAYGDDAGLEVTRSVSTL